MPNKAKRAKGYVVCEAKLLHTDKTLAYKLEDFAHLLPKADSGAQEEQEGAGAKAGSSRQREEAAHLDSLDDIGALRGEDERAVKLRKLIETADLALRLDPERAGEPYKSRSEAGFAVILQAARPRRLGLRHQGRLPRRPLGHRRLCAGQSEPRRRHRGGNQEGTEEAWCSGRRREGRQRRHHTHGEDSDMGGDGSAKAGRRFRQGPVAAKRRPADGGAKTDGSSEDGRRSISRCWKRMNIPTPHLRDAGLPPSITSLARDIAGATLVTRLYPGGDHDIGHRADRFRRVAYIPHSTWHRHASHYICLVGVPSSTKTASGRDIINILAKLDAETMKANEPKVAKWKADDEAHKAAHDAWRDNLRHYEKGAGRRTWRPASGPAIRTLSETPPTAPRLMVSNVTMQRLVALLRDNPKGLVLVRDEIQAFLGDMGRYGGSGADRADYLTLGPDQADV